MMKEYIPFDIDYWKKLVKNSLLVNIKNQNNTPSEQNLEHILKDKRIEKSMLIKSINENINNKITNKNLISNNNSKNIDVNNKDFLENIIEERRRFLVREISQLDFFIKEREKISYDINYNIDYAILCYSELIGELDFWKRGYNSGVEKRRMHLEKLCSTLENEKRQEEISRWRDILSVTRDTRILLKEYMELMIRRRIIQNK